MRMLTVLMFVCLTFVSKAQLHCASDFQTQLERQVDQAYDSGLLEFDDFYSDFELNELSDVSRTGFKEVIIPVVVHVVYRQEENNISYDQIKSQIDVLNRDFNNENGDHYKIPDVFRDLATSSSIRFQLADHDPDGNFTNGVTRTQTTVENIGTETLYHQTSRGGQDPWPQPHYMNVWVCELEGNTLGFAMLPGAKMSERDGIVMSPRAFGTMGTAQAPYDLGRTFVHEVGHYFGLRHLWGSDDASCTSTDYISDTPTQLKENFGCKTYPSFSCPNESFGDMFMNYMDYGNDSCMLLFTKRQVELMQLVILTNRRALFYSSGFTGVEEVDEMTFNVYPNPSKGSFHIEFMDEIPSSVEVRNTLGELVYEFKPHSRMQLVSHLDLKPGIYFIKSSAYSKQLVIY